MKKNTYDYTKIGPLREGFEYQDAQSIQYFIKWMEKPDIYEWITLEADDFGSLDDIVISRSDGFTELIQVKYSVHPESPKKSWSWTHLTKKIKNKESLFFKWFSSWKKITIHQKKIKVIIKTNKQATGILKETLSSSPDGYNKINLNKFEKTKFYKQLIKVNKESYIKNFLKALRFSIESNLDDLWDNNERRFKDNLGGTSTGWNSIKKSARDWTIKNNIPNKDGKIYLSNIHRAALWYRPEYLNQNFPIPDDFVLFNSDLFKKICDELSKGTGGIKIFYGSPGIGKSTFLNYLSNFLKEKKDLPIIIHNYYIPSKEQFYERLKHQKAIEGFKYKFLHDTSLKKSIKNIAFQNFDRISLKKILKESSNYFNTVGKNLIVIIDGLDHVLNYKNKKELDDFLKEFLPLNKGLWLLIGTQLFVGQSLPLLLLNSCPDNQRIEIHGLSYLGVEHIVKSNRNSLKISEDKFDIFIKKLYEVSKGNPLYLKYCIKFLHELNLKKLYPQNIDSIPPYKGNILNYYKAIWNNLCYEAKEIAILMSSIEANLTKPFILEIITQKDIKFNDAVSGFNTINHLLIFKRGKVQIFHMSFNNFIKNSEDYSITEKVVKKKFLKWLNSDESPDEIEWAYKGILELEVGNSKKFINSLGRRWLYKAVFDNRPLDLILYQLRLGASYCFKKRIYSKGLQLGLLHTYAANAPDEVHDAWNKIWSMQFQKNNKEIDTYFNNLKQLSPYQLEIIAKKAWEFGDSELLENIFEELNFRLIDDNITPDYLPVAFSTVLCLLKYDYKIVLNWINKFLGHKKNKILKNYCDTLLKTDQVTILCQIITDKKILTKEKANILSNISINLLKSNASKAWLKENSYHSIWKSWTLLYLLLNKSLKNVDELEIEIPKPEEFPDSIKEYGDDRYIFEKKYFLLFLNSLVLQILFKKNNIEENIKLCDERRYSNQIYKKLVQLSRILADNFKKKKIYRFDKLTEIYSDLYIPQWPKDREIINFFHALRRIFSKIVLVIHILNSYQNVIAIDTKKLKKFNRFALFDYSDLIEFIINEKIKILNNNACCYLLDNLDRDINSEITSLHERAKKYADLAEIAYIYENNKFYLKFVNKSIQNFFCYGYHKDIFLFEVLESLKAFGISKPSKFNKWIEQIIPLISEVNNYTDGDETNHLSARLSEILSITNTNLIKSYYLEETENEDYFLAEKIFPHLINSLDLDNPIAKALATTGIDSTSINILKDKKNKGNIEAEYILKINQAYFGKLSVLKTHTYVSQDKYKDKENNKIEVSEIAPKNLSSELENIEYAGRRKFLCSWCQWS